MTKSKPCFKILWKKAFRWHLETWENQIGSIFKLNIKKKCQIPKRKFFPASEVVNISVGHPVYVNKKYSPLNQYFLTVLFSIPFNKLPCSKAL